MKKLKKVLRTIIFIIVAFYLFIMALDTFVFNTHFVYKVNLNIDIPNPKRIDYIINIGFQDGLNLDVMYYSSKKINILKEKEFFQKIEGDNKIILMDKYNDFLEGLGREELEIFNNTINTHTLFTEDNYYALFEKGTQGTNQYSITFLLLDSQSNKVYSISLFY